MDKLNKNKLSLFNKKYSLLNAIISMQEEEIRYLKNKCSKLEEISKSFEKKHKSGVISHGN